MHTSFSPQEFSAGGGHEACVLMQDLTPINLWLQQSLAYILLLSD